jgi:hypothetical protein
VIPASQESAQLYTVRDPVARYRRLLGLVAARLEPERERSAPGDPPFALPGPGDGRWAEFFASTPLTYRRLGEYQGHVLDCLDLMGNPGTRTTKSLASNMIMARAVLRARSSGRPLVIVTPTSGNKGTALRDALARAQALGLPGADAVSVIMAVPPASVSKLRACAGDADPEFTARNPVAVLDVASGGELKELVARAARAAAGRGGKAGYWYTLALDNYRFADSMRAFAEQDAALAAGDGWAGPDPAGPDAAGGRLHAHAVSSGYGLLGYQLGRDVLAADPLSRPRLLPQPGYFLIQHLGAPDMVLHQRQDGQAGPPAYDRDGDRFTQRADPLFPAETDDPAEDIDPTFYTRNPPTAPAMTGLIRAHGGGGIVVSRRECLARYAEVRERFGDGVPLPADPAELREWSLQIAMCGVLNGIDRGLVTARHIVVHASGSFWDAVLPPLDPALRTPVSGPAELAALLDAAG